MWPFHLGCLFQGLNCEGLFESLGELDQQEQENADAREAKEEVIADLEAELEDRAARVDELSAANMAVRPLILHRFFVFFHGW